ncbi:hypothetical protein QUH73_16965 [Labilibaculum sp. K2S]|uniref:hypothetical protein n=1 Tax=Labilibaculum sp. K2S TaxID=3056386 RepID=UPI0025A3314B|nr:hypothetical protein [Labilibaculum sp. K2S]MDM8161515.1 hypothetical protein [Labilibaculum sp. K2S]
MEYLFLFAERVVANLKSELVSNKESIGHYSFDKCLIYNSSLEISFKNDMSVIRCNLSVHPLDMPWKLRVSIDDISLDSEYEIFPNLLKSPNTLGNELSNKLAKDIVIALRGNIK